LTLSPPPPPPPPPPVSLSLQHFLFQNLYNSLEWFSTSRAPLEWPQQKKKKKKKKKKLHSSETHSVQRRGRETQAHTRERLQHCSFESIRKRENRRWELLGTYGNL
jgi:hypothetical protein